MCESEIVSVTLVCPVIHGLLKKHLINKTDDLQAVKAFKEKVTQEILCCFTPDSLEIINEPPLIASALDPHYHQLKFLSDSQRSLVYAVIKEKVAEMLPETAESEETTGTTEDVPKKEESAMVFLLANDSEGTIGQHDEELERYLREPSIKEGEKCLLWWSRNVHNYPILSKVAKRYLCIPATSVPAERVFSTAGLIINEKRSSLLPQNADMLIFLNKTFLQYNINLLDI